MKNASEAFDLSAVSANKIPTVSQEIENELERIILQAVSEGRFDAFTVYHSQYRASVACDILIKNGYAASIVPHTGLDIVVFSWRNA